MALDFQSAVTQAQKNLLSNFVTEEVAKAESQKKRLEFLKSRAEQYLSDLDELQEEVTFLPGFKARQVDPGDPQKTKEYLDAQKDFMNGNPPRFAEASRNPFTAASISEAVDRVKTPLLEAIKGRFERLEFAIRRAYDRAEVLSDRVSQRTTLSDTLSKALQDLNPAANA